MPLEGISCGLKSQPLPNFGGKVRAHVCCTTAVWHEDEVQFSSTRSASPRQQGSSASLNLGEAPFAPSFQFRLAEEEAARQLYGQEAVIRAVLITCSATNSDGSFGIALGEPLHYRLLKAAGTPRSSCVVRLEDRSFPSVLRLVTVSLPFA